MSAVSPLYLSLRKQGKCKKGSKNYANSESCLLFEGAKRPWQWNRIRADL